jgi:hypothetical protein
VDPASIRPDGGVNGVELLGAWTRLIDDRVGGTATRHRWHSLSHKGSVAERVRGRGDGGVGTLPYRKRKGARVLADEQRAWRWSRVDKGIRLLSFNFFPF